MNHGSQSEPTDGPTSHWRQRSVVEVVVVLVAEMYLIVVVVVVVISGSYSPVHCSGCYCMLLLFLWLLLWL